MPGQEKRWLHESDPLMAHIRSGNKQLESGMAQIAISLLKQYDMFASEENWGPMSGQRKAQIEKWLGPELLAVSSLDGPNTTAE